MARSLRLLADDLTGALDSAAAFASATVPVPVRWRGEVPETGAVAWDSGTREVSAEDARAAVEAVAARLMAGPGRLAFKKVDSLLRGNEAAEIAGLLKQLGPIHCIIAPAFPAQRRITRGGRQHVWTGNAFEPVPNDLALALSAVGLSVASMQPGDRVPPGVSMWDACDDNDLDSVVDSAGDVPVLWVGSAGLSAALARAAGVSARMSTEPLARPILGLVGSDRDVTRLQLGRVGRLHVKVEPTADGTCDTLRARLETDGTVFVTVAVPAGASRQTAATTIRSCLARILDRLVAPGTLIVTGGETLRAVCDALGTDRLDVFGSIVPGVPHAKLKGGRWDNVDVVSKSGAFGDPGLLERLISDRLATMAGVDS